MSREDKVPAGILGKAGISTVVKCFVQMNELVQRLLGVRIQGMLANSMKCKGQREHEIAGQECALFPAPMFCNT